MLLGLSLHAFTMLHVVISLIGIVTGFIVVFGMLGSHRMPGWTALFLLTTILTSVTGLMFPGSELTPGRIFAIISLVALAAALLALYGFGLRGAWRWIYVVGAVLALYLNVFVAIVQSFAKIPVLQPLAPTQSEPPFLTAESFLFLIFLVLGIAALRRFHPAPPAA
jgi:hypothetical protein